MHTKQRNVIVSCPSRIDFTGGFTDVLPFRATQWVHHVNLAIDLPTEVSLQARNDSSISIKLDNKDKQVLFSSRDDINQKYSLLKAALEKFNISGGIDIKINSYAPHGAGLGTSGALSVGLTIALYLFTNQPLPDKKLLLAVIAADIERNAGTLSGLQDQFASISGGLNKFGFYKKEYTAKHIELSNLQAKEIENHVLIIYPGGKRNSTNIVKSVMTEYQNGNKTVTNALISLDNLSEKITDALISSRWTHLATLIKQVQEQQLKLHTDLIDSGNKELISNLASKGIEGVKLLGGGGSGACLLVIAKNNKARATIENICKQKNVQLIPYHCAKRIKHPRKTMVVSETCLMKTGFYKIKSQKSLKTNEISINHSEFQRSQTLKSKILFSSKLLFNNKWLTPLLKNKKSHHFVITDTNVGSLYQEKLSALLQENGISHDFLTVPAGEQSKSIKVFEKLSTNILRGGINKNSYIIGFGGGVVNNIAGFLASTLYRGVGLIQIPTSLLAQVDAAIDFKQAINGPDGKNHIGSYYPAKIIVIDPDVLNTLPIRHLRNGLAETIKHALTQDEAFLDYLLSYSSDIRDPSFLNKIITRTIDLKIMLLNENLNQEYGEMLPQYGHAIGHALEQISNYKLLHGEAIAIGMCLTAEIALLLNICTEDSVIDHYSIMKKFGLPFQLSNQASIEEILRAIRNDKHFSDGSMKLALMSKRGSIYYSPNQGCVFSISDHLLKQAIKRHRKRQSDKLNLYE